MGGDRTFSAMGFAFAMFTGVLRGEDEIAFNRDIRPVLANYCVECHGPDEEAREADLRLDIPSENLAELVKQYDGHPSEFIVRITETDPDEVMPPPKMPKQPKPDEIALLRKWAQAGAPFTEHWAFVAPERKALPDVEGDGWSRNGMIDRFVHAKLKEMGMEPQEDAEPTVLARRLALALTGLPASPGDSAKFVEKFAADGDAAVDWWVDELLARDSYGEHFAWPWMDAARYADTNGFQRDDTRVMWPWREWLVESLNKNIPFDRLSKQMLAGDIELKEAGTEWKSGGWISDKEKTDLLVSTGFLRNHRYDAGSGTIPAEAIFHNAVDRIETVGTVWMGMTMQCARCHTHKFDPIEQKEYYGMLSFFDNVPEYGAALKDASHPYIHVPRGGDRERIKALRDESEQSLVELREEISAAGDARKAWEKQVASGSGDGGRVLRGLRNRYVEDGMELDGSTTRTETNDPILMCDGNKRWSISFWFRADGDGDGAFFSSVHDPKGERPGIQADWIDGTLRIRNVTSWLEGYIEFRSKEKLEKGKWHHVSFRCNGLTQALAYSATINGSEEGMECTHPVTADHEIEKKAPLVIGGSPLLPGVKGGIRDLRFYDRRLDDVEVASLAEEKDDGRAGGSSHRETDGNGLPDPGGGLFGERRTSGEPRQCPESDDRVPAGLSESDRRNARPRW